MKQNSGNNSSSENSFLEKGNYSERQHKHENQNQKSCSLCYHMDVKHVLGGPHIMRNTSGHCDTLLKFLGEEARLAEKEMG